jgi:hypothetical protein
MLQHSDFDIVVFFHFISTAVAQTITTASRAAEVHRSC